MGERVAVSAMCLLVCFHQGIVCEDVRKVTSSISESVVLRSDADTSWNLDKIHWSIYDNFTFIAIFENKQEMIKPSYGGRLKLNYISGDLTITNVLSSDALKYRVDLVGQEGTQRKTNFVQLSVLEKLSKPTISVRHRFLDSGICVISLKCSSTSSDISLTWKPEDGFSNSIWQGKGDSDDMVLWTSFTPNRVVNFSCIATDGSRTESGMKSVNCAEPEPRGNHTQPEKNSESMARQRSCTAFLAAFFAFLAFLVVSILGIIIYNRIFQRRNDAATNAIVESSTELNNLQPENHPNGEASSSPNRTVTPARRCML